jgi:hypothetical protein
MVNEVFCGLVKSIQNLTMDIYKTSFTLEQPKIFGRYLIPKEEKEKTLWFNEVYKGENK